MRVTGTSALDSGQRPDNSHLSPRVVNSGMNRHACPVKGSMRTIRSPETSPARV